MADNSNVSRSKAGRSPYEAPTLTVFGAATHLTASGTSDTGEGMGGGNTKKP